MSEAPGAWKYYVTGVSEYSQQCSNLKGDGYKTQKAGEHSPRLFVIQSAY